MHDRFRSLASMLSAPPSPAPSLADNEPAVPVVAPQPEPTTHQLRELRLFKASVGEAVEEAVETILTDIAAEVLARELHLAPAAIDAVVARAVERFFDEGPVRVRVHPADAPLITCGVPVVHDGTLLPGDAVLELRSGEVDARLGVRLACVLENFA